MTLRPLLLLLGVLCIVEGVVQQEPLLIIAGGVALVTYALLGRNSHEH